MKIIQLTDTHLMAPGLLANGVDPEKQLRAAVEDIREKHPDADLLVITGDLCNYGEPAAYELLREILASVPLETRLLIGNHDDRPNFVAAFPSHPVDENGYVQSYLDTPFGRLLFLDSHEPGMIGGSYGDHRQAWLSAALAGAGTRPVTVFIHHPPVETGIGHFEAIGMHDDGAIMRHLSTHPAGVRHIVFGHIHVPLAGTTAEGVAFSSGQACSHRFITDLDQREPWWTGGNPCYRIIKLNAEGFCAFEAEVGQTPMGRALVCHGP